MEYCSDPGSIENAQMEGTAPFTCISTLKYTCKEGYWLLGAETLKCRINGQWNHAKPSCIDKSKKYSSVADPGFSKWGGAVLSQMGGRTSCFQVKSA